MPATKDGEDAHDQGGRIRPADLAAEELEALVGDRHRGDRRRHQEAVAGGVRAVEAANRPADIEIRTG